MNNIMKNRSKELEEKALNYFKTFIEDSRLFRSIFLIMIKNLFLMVIYIYTLTECVIIKSII